MINEPAFDDRYCLFFDFLGTRAAAATWSRDRLYEFVDLLRSIALARSTEEINGQSREDGSYRISVRPEISTFSDHVVVSWRTSGELIVDSLWTDIVLKDALRVLSAVAERALRIGLLVRGGMSVGQLFHGDDVVFGEAMVTAYELECSVAKYPRVVVAGGIIDRLNPTRPEDCTALLQDHDGHWCLNYFIGMVHDAAPCRDEALDPVSRLSPLNLERMEIDIAQASRWKRAHLDRIDREIAALRQTGATKAATKWEWFKERFEWATARIP
jgi:hypothetical protein